MTKVSPYPMDFGVKKKKNKKTTPPSLTDFQICGDEKQEFFSWPYCVCITILFNNA